MFMPSFTSSTLLTAPSPFQFHYRTITFFGHASQSVHETFTLITVPQDESWFGLFRFRSPLLTESRLLSFPPVTEMFQFTGFAFIPYTFRYE